jgi:hypothetical protein
MENGYGTYIPRQLVKLIIEDFCDIDALFINGARQVGKSTLAETIGTQFPKVFYASFDDITLRAAERAGSEILTHRVSGYYVAAEIGGGSSGQNVCEDPVSLFRSGGIGISRDFYQDPVQGAPGYGPVLHKIPDTGYYPPDYLSQAFLGY